MRPAAQGRALPAETAFITVKLGVRTMKKPQLILALTAAGVLSLPGLACAGEVEDLKAMLLKMQARIEQLESRPVAAAPVAAAAPAPALNPADVVTRGSMPGSFKVPGTETSIKFGGYVQLDAIYDLKGNQGRAVSAGELPLNGSAGAKRNGTTTFSARSSRLYMQTASPSELGEIKTKIEFDFFTDEGSETYTNSARPRLRHAYGTVGNWLAGQTWSNFMDLDAMPETLEFYGPTGQVFIRQPQLRYTTAIGSASQFSVSVENPQTDARDNGGNVTAIDRGPDLTAKWQHNGDYGHFDLRALVRPLKADDGNGDHRASTNGWALGFGGALKLGANDTLLYQFNGGQGIGRYIQDVYGAAAYDASTGTLSAQKAAGGYLALQHFWNTVLRSTVSFNATHINNKTGFGDITGLNTDTRQVHANLIWKAASQLDVGMEYVWSQRKVEGGAEGTSSRVQGAVKYNF